MPGPKSYIVNVKRSWL